MFLQLVAATTVLACAHLQTAEADEVPPPPPAPAAGCPNFARPILMDVYRSTADAKTWRQDDGWGSERPCCEWFAAGLQNFGAARTWVLRDQDWPSQNGVFGFG